jgi:adenylosuccinate lyase/3-carboxy-cis,cis-muconate cycloisomerase
MFDMFNSCFTRHWLCGAVMDVWSDKATLQAWLDVESAVAQAQAEIGLIPGDAAAVINRVAKADLFDRERIAADIADTLHPLVPMLRQLEEFCGNEAAGYVHWGLTTQNIFETGAALQLRSSHELLETALETAVDAMGSLAQDNGCTLQAGWTHGQHALPITFGFKVAAWRAELRRIYARLSVAVDDALVARLGGAVGTFAAMGGRGGEVQQRAAAILGLKADPIPIRSSFDRTAAYIGALGQLAAFAEKVALEIIFMQRTEIGEIEESFHHGKIGSSTMAQKRNPARANNLVSICRLLRARVPLALETMVRANEADAASSNVSDVLVPEVAALGVSVATGLSTLVSGLKVFPENMARNLDLSGGLILSEAVMMEPATKIGRHTAHHVLYDAAMECAENGSDFKSEILRNPLLAGKESEIDLDALLDPSKYLGEILEVIRAEIAEK